MFSATLEMAKVGKAELVQKQAFGPMFIRARAQDNKKTEEDN